jgi:DNA (cytosine-5)-methyltransferase 1
MNCKKPTRKHRKVAANQKRSVSAKSVAAKLTGEMKSQSPRVRRLFPEIWNASVNPWPSSRYSDRRRGVGGDLSTLELCAGAGGQALGFEQAGILHRGLIEIDKHACATLKLNRPNWEIVQTDLNTFNGSAFRGVDIVSGGLPCPPFSVAGKQLGHQDERNLFPAMLRIVDQVRPRAVMIENVRGILDAVFEDYRNYIGSKLKKLGFVTGWNLMNASDFGVPQLRPRVIFVALRSEDSQFFSWPDRSVSPPKTVGETLRDLMAANGWKAVTHWCKRANEIAPTIVGGSHKHGGPDLGPTRARRAWATLNVDGLGIANEPPAPEFVGMPKLTVRMVARLQGFPDSWQFFGSKTNAYRQVGNALPPPFAYAVASQLKVALTSRRSFVQVAG